MVVKKTKPLFFSFLIFIYLLFFKYSFLPFPLSQPNPPALLTSLPFPLPHYCPCVLHNCSYKPFTVFPLNSLPAPLCSLSACSQFQCLCLYFACLFVLLIRFLLKVRSYRKTMSIRQKERRSSYPMQQHGWNWKALC